MRKIAYVGLVTLIAGAAFGAVSEDAAGVPGSVPGGKLDNDGIGSILGSWATPAGSNARACCETGGYVIVNTYYNPQYVCTPAGSLVRTHTIPLGTGWRDSSRCHLGSGYYAIIKANAPLIVALVNHSTGSVASTFATTTMNPWPMNLAYDPQYNFYYANGYYETTFARKYTTAGSLSGNIMIGGMGTTVGALGWTRSAKGVSGAYIWASNFGAKTDAICTTTGTVIATWSAADRNGCGGDCGKHHSGKDWVVWEIRSASLWCYEYDIEGTTTSVTPVSLGEIKTLFK